MGNDISGFADPDYLPAAAEFGAAVVATHIRLAPRVADPDPQYDDVVADVSRFLTERAERARAAGIPPERIVLDAGLDLGKTAAQSLTLLRASSTLAALGYPLLLSASNKTFLGVTLDLELTERGPHPSARRHSASPGDAASCACTTSRARCRVRDVAAAVSAPVSAARPSERLRRIWSRATTPRWWPRRCATLLAEVVGDRDHSLVVEEIGGGPGDDINVGAVVDACLTPPFLIDRRVVVVRDAGRLLTRRRAPLGRSRQGPPALDRADPGRRRRHRSGPARQGHHGGGQGHRRLGQPPGRPQGVAARASPPCARSSSNPKRPSCWASTSGRTSGRVEGLLGALAAAYGAGARITVDDLEPYLGEAGNVARYELTDAIDRG